MELTNIHKVPYAKNAFGGESWSVREDDVKVKLIRYPKGHQIKAHRHTDEKAEKIVLEGEVEFSQDDKTVVLRAGDMYMCGSGRSYYVGLVRQDTIMLTIESRDSKTEFPEDETKR